MNKSFQDWVAEGEAIYNSAMSEYQSLESQIEQMEMQLTEKKAEVNHIAQMLGKPPVEGSKRLTAQLIDRDLPPAGTIGSVTRALTGRGIVAR